MNAYARKHVYRLKRPAPKADPSRRMWWSVAEFAKCFGLSTRYAREYLQRCGALRRHGGRLEVDERAICEAFPERAVEMLARLRGQGE